MPKWNDAQRDEFDMKAFKVLSNMLPEKFAESIPVDEAEKEQYAIVQAWLKAGASEKAFDHVSDALVDFQRFVASQYIKHGQSKDEYIELSMTLDYGSGSGIITFKLGTTFAVSSPNDRLSAQATLYQSICGMRDDFERSTMLRVKSDVSANSSSFSPSEFLATRLIVGVDDGKVSYKVRGGQFEKYGVRIYPEVIKQAGIDIKAIPVDGSSLEGWKALYTTKNGKPEKVINLVKMG